MMTMADRESRGSFFSPLFHRGQAPWGRRSHSQERERERDDYVRVVKYKREQVSSAPLLFYHGEERERKTRAHMNADPVMRDIQSSAEVL